MKSTGMVRRLDNLGRFVLPSEIRKVLDINEKEPIEIYIKNDMIVLKKYKISCVFCGASNNLHTFKDKNVCSKCAKEMSEVTWNFKTTKSLAK